MFENILALVQILIDLFAGSLTDGLTSVLTSAVSIQKCRRQGILTKVEGWVQSTS
jgi:hypothetical protein